MRRLPTLLRVRTSLPGAVCKMLIDAGAEGVGIPDKFAMKPANLAERSGRKKSKEYLLQCEAAFDATRERQAPPALSVLLAP
jgi:hypothetical protein|eukprot:7384891-Prymnesium_polylepis.1